MQKDSDYSPGSSVGGAVGGHDPDEEEEEDDLDDYDNDDEMFGEDMDLKDVSATYLSLPSLSLSLPSLPHSTFLSFSPFLLAVSLLPSLIVHFNFLIL